MQIQKLKEHIKPAPNSMVTVKRMGNITEVRYKTNETGGIIIKLDKDNYCDTRTGEVKEYNTHAETRVENLENVSRSLRNLRDIINTNVIDHKKCKWVTLTYKENMKDPKRLYNDYRKFNMRLKRFLKSRKMPQCDYIAAAEPQERGAWHFHVLYIFPKKAPFIDNEDLARLWGHGHIKVRALKAVDNVGVYLTAYLGDMDFLNAFGEVNLENRKIKEVKTVDEQGRKCNKAIVKGARLRLYPAGFRIYRCSRGIKLPVISECTEAEAMRLVANQALTYESTVQLSDNGAIINTINYRHYNSKAKQR